MKWMEWILVGEAAMKINSVSKTAGWLKNGEKCWGGGMR